SFLVPETSLGQDIHCPYDGCRIRLPPPPFRESATLRRFGEADWLRASDLKILLEYALGWMSRRQQRLFAAACCRRAWHLDPVLIDTNILMYLIEPRAPLHAVASSKLQNLQAAGHPLWISRQIVREYLAAMSRPGTATPPLSMSTLLADALGFLT